MYIPGAVLVIVICIIFGSLLCEGTKSSNFLLFFIFSLDHTLFPIRSSLHSYIAITATGSDSDPSHTFSELSELAVGFEAFLESGPQTILQLRIILNSGIGSTTKIV